MSFQFIKEVIARQFAQERQMLSSDTLFGL